MKTDDLRVPKVDKNDWTITMDNMILHLKLVRGVRCVPLAYVIRHHIKVANILTRYSTYLNLDEEMIVGASVVHADIRAVLAYWHQWELEQMKTDNLKVPKSDKNN